MVWGEIIQCLARRLGWQPRPWPRGELDQWGAPLLATGFAVLPFSLPSRRHEWPFAKLAMIELRAQSGTCSGSFSSYGCLKGGPAVGEGLATAGCPLGTHPAHLTDNRNCVLCFTCAACWVSPPAPAAGALGGGAFVAGEFRLAGSAPLEG